MASIPKIFHSLEKKEMTLSEYEKYMNEHPYHSSIKAIRCVECGDAIVYCNGFHNASYFKHSPTHEGHGYCSLYHEGTESKTYESLIRKKFFKEEDISLNFELKYQDGSWKSLITIPPFSRQDLDNNTKNNTKIIINETYTSNIIIPIDNNHFKPGELKRIGLNRFPSSVKIKITGKSTSRDMSYTMDGFIPNEQIYSSLILQNYIGDYNSSINLKNIKMFVCKKLGGKIYTGRHYLVFDYGNYGLHISNDVRKDISIIKLELKNNTYFNYSVYDIVFNKVTEATENFCTNRGCELVEKDDAVILWPPMNSIGNYKYYKNNETKMFILFENKSDALELYEHDTSYLYFKVQNINATPFFVMKFNGTIADKKFATFNYLNDTLINLDKTKNNYIFKSGFLNGKIDSNQVKIKKNDKVLSFKSSLERTMYSLNKIVSIIDINRLKIAIWYSTKFVPLRDIDFEYLINKFQDNEFVVEYLDMCACTKKIKKAAIELLMEV